MPHRKATTAELFGRVIRTRRQKLGLSQEDVAFKAEIDRNYYGEIERGEKNVSLDVARRISSALGIQLSYLIRQLEKLSWES